MEMPAPDTANTLGRNQHSSLVCPMARLLDLILPLLPRWLQ